MHQTWKYNLKYNSHTQNLAEMRPEWVLYFQIILMHYFRPIVKTNYLKVCHSRNWMFSFLRVRKTALLWWNIFPQKRILCKSINGMQARSCSIGLTLSRQDEYFAKGREWWERHKMEARGNKKRNGKGGAHQVWNFPLSLSLSRVVRYFVSKWGLLCHAVTMIFLWVRSPDTAVNVVFNKQCLLYLICFHFRPAFKTRTCIQLRTC